MAERRQRGLGEHGDELRQEMRALRLAQGMSMGEVARRMIAAGHPSWDASTVYRVESGGRTLTVDEALCLVACVITDAAVAAQASPLVLWLLEGP